MLEGNALLAGSNTTFNGHTYTKNDISAATQVAIWIEEYGSLTYNVTSGSSLSPNDFSGLVSYLRNNAIINANWLLLNGGANHQSLGTYPVPLPLAGAGFPGIALAGLGLLLWRRRATRALDAA